VPNRIMRRVVIPGGSGNVGRLLSRHFFENGDSVTVLSRDPQRSAWKTVAWNGRDPGPWTREIDGADIVINLSGRSVDCRYTPANRREIIASRVDSTRAIGRAIAQSQRPPSIWTNASTATIYRHSLDHAMDELTGEIGGGEAGAPRTWDFSIDVATAWERALFESPTLQTRRVALRSSIVMIPGVSWLGKVTNLARWGLGGTEGPGNQYMSWIHQTDFVRAIEFLISRHELQGPINVCSPNPLPNREFLCILRDSQGVRFAPPLATWMLHVGSVLLRTEAELILKSRRVIPTRLLNAGFRFQFPEWREAAKDLLSAERQGHHSPSTLPA